MNSSVLAKPREDKILEGFRLFKRERGLSKIDIEPPKVCDVVNLFITELGNKYNSLVVQYDNSCIIAGCLAFGLLKVKPIVSLGVEPRMYQYGLLHENINEEFALYNALPILNIKQGNITNKTIIPNLIRSFRSQSEQGNLNTESLVEDMQRLCDAVPNYMRNKK